MVSFQCLEEMKREARTIKIDRRLTGANIIDEPLQQVSFSMWYLNSICCVLGAFLLKILKKNFCYLCNMLETHYNAVLGVCT